MIYKPTPFRGWVIDGKARLLAAAVALFLATRLKDERLGLLAAVVLARARIATALSGLAGFLTVGHAVEPANLPRGKLDDSCLFTCDGGLNDGSRCGGLGGCGLEDADCAVGECRGFRIRGGDGNGDCEGGKNTSH
ncbi:hypothetical protein EBT16_05125 [bacterium]|nr:hypothetical protein [bacterium]